MKIAIYKFGRENNGGHTTVCVDFKKFCDLNGIDTHFYSYSPGKKKRQTYFNKEANFSFDEFCEFDADDVLKELNTFDLIVLLEPPTKAGSKHDCNLFMDIYRKATPKKWYQYHDIQMKTTSRNRALLEAIAYSDVVSAHDENSEVGKMTKAAGKTFIPVKLFRNFDDMKELYDNEDRVKEVMYIGRFEIYKGPLLMLTIAEKLKANGILPTMIGVDRSPASYHNLLSHELVENGTLIVGGRYSFDYGFERLKKAMFTFTPMRPFDKNDYANRMEYCQLEGISAGCIPIFHKDQGEMCKFPDGTRWIDIPFFAIWFDPENPDKTADEIIKVANDEKLQKLYKGTALRYMKQQLDCSLFEPYLASIMYSPNARCSVEDVLKSFDWTDEEIEKYNEANENYFIKHNLELLTTKKIRVITGRRTATTLYDKIIEQQNAKWF